MTKRYWTAVFEVNEAFRNSNPFKIETVWGKPVCTAVGDMTERMAIFEAALVEIEQGCCSLCAEIAERAMIEASSYVGEQSRLLRQRVDPAQQLDLEECIAKAGK